MCFIVEYLLNMFCCWKILVFFAFSDEYIYVFAWIPICICQGASCLKLVVYSFYIYIFIKGINKYIYIYIYLLYICCIFVIYLLKRCIRRRRMPKRYAKYGLFLLSRDHLVVCATMMGNECFIITIYIYIIYIYNIYIYIYIYIHIYYIYILFIYLKNLLKKKSLGKYE